MSAASRERYRIIVADGLWRGYDVAIEPPVMAYPLRHFCAAVDAQAYAESLVATEGWPVVDRTAGGQGA